MRARLYPGYRLNTIQISGVEFVRGVWREVPDAIEDKIKNNPIFEIEETEPVAEMIVQPRKAKRNDRRAD